MAGRIDEARRDAANLTGMRFGEPDGPVGTYRNPSRLTEGGGDGVFGDQSGCRDALFAEICINLY